MLLNLNEESYVDFVLNDSHWHPYKPRIEIQTLSIKKAEPDIKFIEIEGLKVEFNLLSSFHGSFIEAFYAEDTSLLIDPSTNEDQFNLNDLWLYISSIKNLRINQFSLIDSSNYLNTLEGELSLMALKSEDFKAKFSAQNKAGGRLDFGMYSIKGSKSLKDYKGFFNTSNFALNEGITAQLCSDCPSGTLDSKAWFTLIDLKLVKFTGDIEFKLNSSLDFINSINAKVELEDSRNNIFRISSFVNGNPVNNIPEIFTSFASEEAIFFIPKIELGEDKFINKFLPFFELRKDLLLKGYITNLIFNLTDSFEFRADFGDLVLKSNEFSVSGLGGNLEYAQDVSRLKIDTPYLQIDLGSIFDTNLIFNNLSSELDLHLIDKKVSISNSTFKGTYKRTLIQGEVSLYPSPFDDTGDLSFKITSNKLGYLDALNLFPNLNNTKLTKSWLKNSISCGSLKEVSIIYRGPVDNKYADSSSSFQSKGLLNNSCLNVNNVSIKNINLIARINNSSFMGEIIEGDLYGSEIEGVVKTFKDNNSYKLELKGNSEGPLLTLLRLANLNQIFNTEEESGKHYTNFYFISPLSSTLEILGKNSNLELSTKIKGGNFNNKKTKTYFSDLYSSIDYDSTNGVKDGFATIKINDIPLKFDIKKGKGKGSFNTQIVTEDTLSAKKILSSFDIKEEISGSSKFNIKLTLGSFIKEEPLLDPVIEVLSNPL